MKEHWIWFFRGIPFGIANILPGISGGTIALMLGYYDGMVEAVRCVRLGALIPLALGVGASILAGSWTVLTLVQLYPAPTYAVMLGFLAASGLIIAAKADMRYAPRWFVLVLGTAAAWGFAAARGGAVGAEPGMLGLVVVGMAASSAMLVPGISGAAVFLLFGYYEIILEGVTRLDLAVLLPTAAGIVMGVFVLAAAMEYLLRRYPNTTYALLAGLILGSTRMVLIEPTPLHAVLFAAGFGLAIRLGPVRL